MFDVRSVVRAVAPAAAIIFLQLVLWPVSAGTFVSGLILGGLGALLALGMALIYRANNVVSFAQADLGSLPATAAIVVMEVWGFTYWMSLVGGLLAAALVGAIVELAFVRRFFSAPRLIVTVATIGVSFLDPSESDLSGLSSGESPASTSNSRTLAAGRSRFEWLLGLAALAALAFDAWVLMQRRTS